MNLFLNDHTHGTGIPIDFEQLPIVEGARCIVCANHRRDMILTGNNRTVRQHPTGVSDNG